MTAAPPDRSCWSDTLVAVLLGGLIAVTGGCGPAVRGNGTNVLLITYETTRADHLKTYGYTRETSPRLDRLASRGALFEQHCSVSPRTNPSVASFLTGTYPHEHGVRNLFLPLEPANLTIAEVLSDAGYRTGAVQTHPRLLASSGMAQGFDDYEDDYRSHPRADQACGVAERWITRQAKGSHPWFLWIHLMDPHWTYDPPRPFDTAFGPSDPRPRAVYSDLAAKRRRIGPLIFQNTMPRDEVQAFIDLYDGELRFTDEAVGAFLERLEGKGLLASTAVILTSDHGESLGEHGYFFEHGDRGSAAEIHVPLVVVAPGRVPEGLRIPWTTRSIDLAPTILDLAGLPGEGKFRGASLLTLLREPGRGADRACLGETDRSLHEENPWREVSGSAGKWRWIQKGRFKLVHRPRRGGTADRLLFDLETDRGETRDVTPEFPEVAAILGRELDAWLSEDHVEDREYHITDEARELLRSLGYVN